MTRYRTIVADPPWPFVWQGGAGGRRRSKTKLGYELMTYMIENPIGALSTHVREPDFIFDPFEFGGYLEPAGDAYTKRTCLWTGNGFLMPVKRPVEPTEGSLTTSALSLAGVERSSPNTRRPQHDDPHYPFLGEEAVMIDECPGCGYDSDGCSCCEPVLRLKQARDGSTLHLYECQCGKRRHQGGCWYASEARAFKSYESRTAASSTTGPRS